MPEARERPRRAASLWVASLALAVASGLLLSLWYSPSAALDSLARLELGSRAGRVARAVHAWSLVGVGLFALWAVLDSRRRARWLLGLVLLVAIGGSGLLLRGDAWTTLVGRSLPPLGLLALHVALALPLAYSGWKLVRRAQPGRQLALALASSLVLGWLSPPRLEDPLEPQGRLLRRLMQLQGSFESQRPRALVIPMSLTAAVRDVPLVLGRREGCLGCHAAVRGLGPAHDAQKAGCSPCHLGNPFRADAAGAHEGLLLVPGNLDGVDRSCGRCHAEIAVRVRTSLMARASGIVAVDRFVFGEQSTPDGDTPISALGSSPADTHLKQLCSNCHLGNPKRAPAPTSELSRGGGCVACHLSDDPARTPAADDPRRFVHPGLTARVRDESCFGCHSRSARISLTYAGWRETFDASAALPGARRALQDGRSVVRVQADVHHEKGLACIDCHTSRELMGDGAAHQHEEQATRVRCSTCHRTSPARTLPLSKLEPGAAALVRARDGERAFEEHLLEDRSGEPLTNARPLPDGSVELRGKLSGARHVAKQPVGACSSPHERLSCQSCHAAWAHRCVSCHTQRDRDGTWVEYDAEPQVQPPSLGVFDRDGREQVEPFVPGMVLTLNPPHAPIPAPLPKVATELHGPATRLVRAYAFSVPHTVTRRGRSCRSCHLDSIALGFGEGSLRVVGSRWHFEPKWPASPFDGLPLDAWIGFLSEKPGATTRLGQRSLRRAEQERVLAVGACFGCHDPDQRPELYRDWQTSRQRMTPACGG